MKEDAVIKNMLIYRYRYRYRYRYPNPNRYGTGTLIYAREKIDTTNSVRDRYDTGTVLIPIISKTLQNIK